MIHSSALSIFPAKPQNNTKRHIATSVADLHTIDGTPMPSFFHNDREWVILC
jgi:hypothetical protein